MVTKHELTIVRGTEPRATRIGTKERVLAWPRLLLVGAAILVALSLFLPAWSLKLHAPQYPGGLVATIYPHRLAGDISEIDGLNHYIGMMKLTNAAALERKIAPVAVLLLALLALLAATLRARWTALLALPIAAYPFIFVGDLFFWLYRFGHELDPHAALSSSIHPFTPHLLGAGKVGQFSTTARFDIGYYVAFLAAALAIVGVVARLRKPE